MSDHFHGFKDKVSFFFDENKNDAWIAILSKVIKAKQEKDPRIGEWAFIKSGEYRGIPCQAADLLAFVHRQHMQTVYEKGQHQPSRILDFIISKNAYPKNHLGSRLAKIPMGEWRDLIKALREDRKVKDIACDILGQPRQPYYPASHQLVKQIYNK
jgi:hypothetical protein